jgi:hypothetical protein
MTVVHTPQARCRVGVARCDITPPVGIYHRMWGAALHDRATGVHRPLTATALCLGPTLILSLDHCLLDRSEVDRIKAAVSRESGIADDHIQLCLTHTHAAGLMLRSRAHLPGGELIGPYLDEVAAKCGRIAAAAVQSAQEATIVYGTGRCMLAKHRDFRDPATGQYVCGYNPDGPADDTLLVARIVADEGKTLSTVVNYACHPTTLAWQNTLISPDYVGALRETLQRETGAPCLFLLGASGDLGPRVGFVGDVQVADANGRQVGYAALATLEALPPPASQYAYAGPVVSGATIGTWRHEPSEPNASLSLAHDSVDLSYRPDLPTLEQTRVDLARWQAAETAATDDITRRDSHAQVERMTRQIMRLEALPPGQAYHYCFGVLELGDALWLFCPGELYQVFQTTLRSRFPDRPIIVATIANDWQPGYIPAADAYGKGIYQETISPLAAGSLELLIEAVSRAIRELVRSRG